MIALIAIFSVISFQTTIGLITDSHLDINYQPNIPYLNSAIACHDLINNGSKTNDIANFGRRKCDSPLTLFNEVLKKMQQTTPIDIMVFGGDMVVHGVSSWTTLKNTIRTTIQSLTSFYPNTPMIFTLGNNDVPIDYQVPTTAFKQEYYSTIYNYWLNEIPENQKFDTQDNRNSFMNGGYYYIDHDNVRYISINTLYYSKNNNINNDPQAADDQLVWLDQLLKDTNRINMKSILVYHIPLGSFLTPTGMANFWNETYSLKFLSIIQSNSNNIIISISGHTHIEDLRVNNMGVGKLGASLYNNNLVVRSICPNSMNNPGFGILSLINDVPTSHVEYSFNLDQTINATDAGKYWSKLYESNQNLGMANLTSLGMADFQSRASKNMMLYLKYLAYKLGD